jgi:uncharacterized membrane protein YphA (DoxX/SURF4 family)
MDKRHHMLHIITMLSLLPYMLSLELFVPTFLRLIVATFLVFQAYCLFSSVRHSTVRQVIADVFSADWAVAMRILVGILRVIAAILLILGIFTQIGALVAALLFVLRIVSNTYQGELVSTDVLLIIICLCIAILGPGAFAIDYPF